MADVARERYQDFRAFWCAYLGEHSRPGTRVLHFFGTSVALICIVTGLLRGSLTILLAGPLVGYGAAWTGHVLVEGNRPTTFRYPGYSLLADLKLWALMLLRPRRIEGETHRVRVREGFPTGENPLSAERRM